MEKETKENIDSSNDEQETTDSSNSDTSEETTEEESTTEETKEESKEKKHTDSEKKLYARATKAEKELKELKSKYEKTESSDKGSKEEVTEATLARLENRGVMEKEDQDYVLKFAKNNDLSPIDALNDEIVQDRLKANERKRKSADATPKSNNRTGDKESEVDAAVRKYQKTGELPENNPSLTMKILRKLKEED